MTFDRFDVVVVPFPFTDRSASLRRPAIVVSSLQDFGAATGQALLTMITRAQGSEWPFDSPLRDISAAGLTKGCLIRMKLFTLDASLILRRIGRLAAIDSTRLQDTLAQHLGYKDMNE